MKVCKFKRIAFLMVVAITSSGCSTEGNDLCIFGIESWNKSYTNYDNPIYQDAKGKELSRQARNKLLKQADEYAKGFINEDYDIAETLCPKLDTNDIIFETLHVQSKITYEDGLRFLTVPIDYTGSQSAVVQLIKDRDKPFSSRIKSDSAEVAGNKVVEGPCLNNLCNKNDLIKFCESKQRTLLKDEKYVDNLKTSYIRESGIAITFPTKEKKIYECKKPKLF